MDNLIIWSFPLIVVAVYLIGSISKPDLPPIQIELPTVDQTAHSDPALPLMVTFQ